MGKALVVITGASSGIGATFARRLAPTNDLLLIARRKDKLDALAVELMASSPSNIEVLAADLTVEADLEKVAERIENEPELGLLINNAGFGSKGRFWEIPLNVHSEMNKLHVTAVTRLTHAALRNMVGRDFGNIINVASVAAFLRSPGSASYCATKTWMTAFTETLYLELKGMRIERWHSGALSRLHLLGVSRQNGDRAAEACTPEFLAFRRRDSGRFFAWAGTEEIVCHPELALPDVDVHCQQTAHQHSVVP